MLTTHLKRYLLKLLPLEKGGWEGFELNNQTFSNPPLSPFLKGETVLKELVL
jgi:hypothetical protein